MVKVAIALKAIIILIIFAILDRTYLTKMQHEWKVEDDIWNYRDQLNLINGFQMQIKIPNTGEEVSIFIHRGCIQYIPEFLHATSLCEQRDFSFFPLSHFAFLLSDIFFNLPALPQIKILAPFVTFCYSLSV